MSYPTLYCTLYFNALFKIPKSHYCTRRITSLSRFLIQSYYRCRNLRYVSPGDQSLLLNPSSIKFIKKIRFSKQVFIAWFPGYWSMDSNVLIWRRISSYLNHLHKIFALRPQYFADRPQNHNIKNLNPFLYLGTLLKA